VLEAGVDGLNAVVLVRRSTASRKRERANIVAIF
jgi:hypothetical protein